MRGWIAAVTCVLLATAIFWIIKTSRRRRLSDAALTALGFACVLSFTALNLSDWLAGWLSDFWLDHPIIGATIDTLLLGGVIYLSYKAADYRHQESLDTKIAVAGRAGVVDHLVEVDVALALACGNRRQLKARWPEWEAKDGLESGKALNWLRSNREYLYTENGELTPQDPRSWSVDTPLPIEDWRRELVDQCIRRIMTGMREWAVVLTRSREGQADLVRFGEIRLQLVEIDDFFEDSDAAGAIRAITKCQKDCRELAFAFEKSSKPHSPRPEVIRVEKLTLRKEAALSGLPRSLVRIRRWWRPAISGS